MEKKIKMKIKSLRYEVEDTLFLKMEAEDFGELFDESFDENMIEAGEEAIELGTEGFMRIEDGRVLLGYDETELTGMEGSSTSIFFDESNQGLVSMHRDGAVSTAQGQKGGAGMSFVS